MMESTSQQERGVGMLAKCAGVKKNGEPCSLSALGSSSYCWAHNPDNAEKRRQVASTGGKGKAAKNRTVYEELHALAEWHKELAVMVREGRISRATAQTMSNLLNNAASAYIAGCSDIGPVNLTPWHAALAGVHHLRAYSGLQ